jgi:seryl-tRNA synthetase
MDEQRRTLMHEIEELKAKQNKLSKEIPQAQPEQKASLLAESKITKEQLKKLEPKLFSVDFQRVKSKHHVQLRS